MDDTSIDEINRGNISKTFGELITLIEDTKCARMEDQAFAILPYSGEAFRIISGNPRQLNYRDESAGLCVSAQKI